MYASLLMAGAPISASAEQGGQRKGTSDQGRVGGDGVGCTHIALLKQVIVIPAVVQKPLACVPHVTVKAQVDIGISSRAFEFSSAHGHTVPGHCQGEKGTH